MEPTTESLIANAERGLPTDRRIAAVELLLAQGWSWSGKTWMPPSAHVGSMVLAGWLQTEPGVTVAHVGAEVPVTLIRSTQIHVGPVQPIKNKPDNCLFPLYTPAVLQEGECHVCSPNGLYSTDGAGPWDCYNCGKPAPAQSPGQSLTAERFGIEIPADWKLVPMEMTLTMALGMRNGSQNTLHPAYRGDFPAAAAGWDAAIADVPSPFELPEMTMMVLVPIELPSEVLEPMAAALADCTDESVHYPHATFRKTWLIALYEIAKNVPGYKCYSVKELQMRAQ